MKAKFGDIAELTKKQADREHFSEIPIGTRCLILNEVNLPGYDALAHFNTIPPQKSSDLDSDKYFEFHYQGYLDRGSYKIIGTIFKNPELLKK